MYFFYRVIVLGLLAVTGKYYSCVFVSLAYSGIALAQLATYESFLQAASQWPTGPGALLVPQQPDHELSAMMAEIDPARIQAIITKLVSFGTRNTMSNQTNPLRGIGAARDWIASEMRTFAATSGGRMTVAVRLLLHFMGYS
jgi:hypothetical protein